MNSQVRVPSVLVFGAGIAGLTAAHELVERGFRVVLYERGGEQSVGGVAASQWHESTRLRHRDTGAPLLLPGEHGFRVFQSYYRHCDDTMRRIPGEKRDRVIDHLVPTYKAGYTADDSPRPLIYDRRPSKSTEGAQLLPLLLVQGLGWDLRDCHLLGIKVAEYMTSSSARRLGEYEQRSLYEFFGVDRLSPRAQKHLSSLFRLLLAMDLRRADARTQGNILVQLMMDQVSGGRAVDRVLDGPTSERWFKPWRRHLETLGVEFRFATELSHLKLDDDQVSGAWIREGDSASLRLVSADYFVAALPVQSLARVLRRTPELLEADAKETNVRAANGDAPLRHVLHMSDAREFRGWMSGVQFYLSEDIRLLPGHLQLLDSEWALSIVSQPQFWGPNFITRYGGGQVRGLLSVDLCDFETRGRLIKKPAAECTMDELAREIWAQMAPSVFGRKADPLGSTQFLLPPPYLDHHVDALISYDPRTGRAATNLAPFFITPPNSFWRRPGPIPNVSQPDEGYRMRLGSLVVAGAYAQTFTGLTTMEAANESARHAVNSILRTESQSRSHSRFGSYEPCTIFPLELSELSELRRFKLLDEQLYARGQPHAFELLGLEERVDKVTPRGVGLPKEASVDASPEVHRMFESIRERLLAFARFEPP
jgi:15-cis-phytoene desaturase